MPDFDEVRRRLRQARAKTEDAQGAAFAAREKLRHVDEHAAGVHRVLDPGRAGDVDRANLRVERDAAAETLRKAREEQKNAEIAQALLLAEFEALSDPRQAIAEFDDDCPILMLPVRLETRFKTIPPRDDGLPSTEELWVRIYPDDCSVDSFEETLSEREVARAKAYWIGIWQAGGFEEQERGAWRALVASHGAGRAEWIIAHYQPLNLAGKPAKARPVDFILTIGTEVPLDAAETAAAAQFWAAAWLADGKKADEDAARAALIAAVGAGRAKEIESGYAPANFAKKPAPPLTKADVAVSVAFVVFPRTADLALKRSSWARAPRAVLLPDRFIFIGYQRGVPEPVIQLGKAVPTSLVVGPDPSAPAEDQLQHDANGDLVIPEEMKWMVDFDRAVEVGMGFRIDVTANGPGGFERVLVVGLRASDDRDESTAALQTLIEHHRFSRKGFALVPQGTPTNNTEEAGSGFVPDDADATFDDLKKGPLFVDTPRWIDKADGQWLAEYLGLDTAALARVRHSGGRDQADARAMNAALWPATLGYWMETMMEPIFDSEDVDQTHELFTQFVSGRGAIPAVRIGRQPYGILPATALSRMKWMESANGDDGPRPGYLQRLYNLLTIAATDWRTMTANVAFIGKAGDAHRTQLDVVGLHPGSVEFSSRYAESAEQLFNQLNIQGLGGFLGTLLIAGLQQRGRDLLKKLGYEGDAPDILGKYFYGRHELLKGPLIDDVPLSETAAIRAYTPDGRNYVQWLIDAAKTSLDAIYRQQGFTGNVRPQALLFLMLRHALQLGFHGASVNLHVETGLLDPPAARRAKHDEPFIHVAEQASSSESRYQLLYKTEPLITGDAVTPVGQYIAQSMHIGAALGLNAQVNALERLKDASTARLERAFADHIDCCSYRLDAWWLGMLHVQLSMMRKLRDGHAGAQKGIYLGAYAWLENLRPERRVIEEVPPLQDPLLAAAFQRRGEPPLTTDSANQGYIHAPSLNQAVAAAVLRNGYITNASRANAQTMAVNLTSDRVRTALAMLEGIRAGQSLSALLGYQFERGLHDRHGPGLEADKFILELRREFPLRGGRMTSTRPPEGTSIEDIEARNVIDGLALVEHIKTSPWKQYPFGSTTLPPATNVEAAAINAEVDRLMEAQDAVADLALAEGVYQAVNGNYDGVASTYDAYSKGDFPPEPEVIRTPTKGFGLTHRVALHLQSGLDYNVSPIAPAPPLPDVPMTPRAKGEPAINAWLTGMLPPLANIGCKVSFRDAAANAMADREVTLRGLGLQPIDLLRIVREDQEQSMAELDDRIRRFVTATHSPRPDVAVTIEYMETINAPIPIFEVMPLIRHLRRLVEGSRPLRSSDITPVNEARIAQDAAAVVDRDRITAVRGDLQALRGELAGFLNPLQALLNDLPAKRADIIAGIDATVAAIGDRFAGAATFAIPQTGWGFAYDFKRRVFEAVLKKAADLVTRWNARLADSDALLVEYQNLPGTATNVEKLALLGRAALLISTTPIDPAGDPDTIRDGLRNVARAAFVAGRDAFAALQQTQRTSVTQLLADAAALLPISAFDATELSFTREEDEAIRFAEDAVRVVKVVLAEVDRRLAASQTLIDGHNASADATARVDALDRAAKALLGDDFFVVPEFRLSAAQGDEVTNAVAASTSGALFEYLTATVGDSFPADTWLYGVARVREKMRFWEQAVMLAEVFGVQDVALTPLQLPYVPGDRWLALEFPPAAKPVTDRLLYTAHFASPFAKDDAQCGLLLDEWPEVIPTSDVETGIALHYDRPNSEAPQAWLLVTPSAFRGKWQWNDLVDALRETLDFARTRAVEPVHVDQLAYAQFLPATVMAVTMHELTISAMLAANNDVVLRTDGS